MTLKITKRNLFQIRSRYSCAAKEKRRIILIWTAKLARLDGIGLMRLFASQGRKNAT